MTTGLICPPSVLRKTGLPYHASAQLPATEVNLPPGSQSRPDVVSEGCALAELSGFLIRRPDDEPAASDPSVFWVAADPLPPADLFLTPAGSAGSKEPDKTEREFPEELPPQEPDPPADLGSAEKKSEIQAQNQTPDLTLLPRRCWPLANNSFLLHGYHNYGHLLLLEDDGRLWLGVPGIYDPREARAADLFGFPRFTSGRRLRPRSQ